MGELEDALRFVLFQNISVICPYHCDVFPCFIGILCSISSMKKVLVTVRGLANPRN